MLPNYPQLGVSLFGLVEFGQADIIPIPNESLTYTGTLLPGDILEIDFKNMTVTKNGANVLHEIEDGFIDWFELGAGEIKAVYADASANRSLLVEITKRTKFL